MTTEHITTTGSTFLAAGWAASCTCGWSEQCETFSDAVEACHLHSEEAPA